MADPVSSADRRHWLGWTIKLAGTALALAVVFSLVPLGEVLAAARRLPPALWLGALAFFLVAHVLTAAKWWMLIGTRGPFARAYQAHLAGLGANLALPGVAGGDVVRAAIIIRAEGHSEDVAAGSIIDRLVDTAALALLALLGLWAVLARDFSLVGLSWRLAALTALAALALLAFARLPLPELAAKGQTGRIKRLALSIGGALARLARTPRLMVASLLASLTAQALLIGINVVLARALALDLPLAVWAYGWSLAKIIAILPISLGGLGVREASLAALIVPFGAEAGLVVAVGLIWQTILYASGIIGIIVGALAGAARRGRLEAAGR